MVTNIEKQHIIAVGAVLGACILILIVIIVTVVLCCLKKGNAKVIQAVKEGGDQLNERFDDLISEIRSAGNLPTSPAQNNGTETRFGPDGGSELELGDVKKQKECEALISFVSDSLSAALDNPLIHDEVKKRVDSVIKKHWKDDMTS